MKRMRLPLVIAAAVGITGLLSAAGQAHNLWSSPPEEPRAQVAAATAPAAAPAQAPAFGDAHCPNFAALAQELRPAVVSIKTETRVKQSRGMGRREPSPGEPFDLFRFFGQGGQNPMPREARGLGSGFVIDSSGLILTNHHVVEAADEIEVSFALPDGTERTMEAKVVGEAADYDVALIKTVADANVAVARLGDSDATQIGEWVMAVGNPFGLDHSVSVGIISAKERRDIAPSGRRGLYNFLQTDASINPGNSGGPLVNARGEVIGINAAINAQGQGIGFAIPVNMVKEMLPQLKKGGKFVRSWVGVKIQPLTPELAESYGLDKTHGVLVAEVMRGSPAADAGLEEGDIILEFDGKKLTRSSDLPLYASMAGVGKKVDLTVLRKNKTRSVAMKLGAFPDDEVVLARGSGDEGDSGTGFGLGFGNLTPEARERLRTEAKSGAVVSDIEPGGAAARAGLMPGDLVLKADGETIDNAGELAKLLKAKKPGDIVRLLVEREGSRLFVGMKR
jgi:serine protease Do